MKIVFGDMAFWMIWLFKAGAIHGREVCRCWRKSIWRMRTAGLDEYRKKMRMACAGRIFF